VLVLVVIIFSLWVFLHQSRDWLGRSSPTLTSRPIVSETDSGDISLNKTISYLVVEVF